MLSSERHDKLSRKDLAGLKIPGIYTGNLSAPTEQIKHLQFAYIQHNSAKAEPKRPMPTGSFLEI